jgi:hypothetical protein
MMSYCTVQNTDLASRLYFFLYPPFMTDLYVAGEENENSGLKK